MRNLWLLMYPQRINLLRLNELRHTRDGKEKWRLIGLLVGYGAAAFVLPMYGALLANGLYTVGAAEVMVMYACALAGALALTVSVVNGYTGLFGRNDTALLGALPFSQGTVALSRLVPMYLSGLVSAALLLAPACVYHLMAFGITARTVTALLLIVLLTPMLPTAVSVLLSAGLAYIGARFRQKNLLIAIFGMLATAGIVLAAQTLPMRLVDTAGVRTLVDAVRAPLKVVYPPSVWVDGALKPGGGQALALFAAVNILPLLLTAWALSRVFYVLHDRVMVAHRGGQTLKQSRAPRAALQALVIKELRGLLGRPMYLMNSCVGVWLSPLMLFLLPVFMPDVQAQLGAQPELVGLIRRMLPVILSLFQAMMSSTASSVSLEGASAWLMCVCPVAPVTIYKSKLYTYLVLALPAVVLSVIAARLLLPISAPEMAAALLLPAAVSVWMGVIGLRWDVRFRRFDFKNETAMVKQSVQTLLTMVSGFATLLLVGVPVYISGAYAAWVSIGCAALLLGASLLLFNPLSRRRIYLVE